MDLSPGHRQLLLAVAKQTMRRALGGADEPPVAVDRDDPEMAQAAGCFVSLHRLQSHRLRGCIGRLDAHGALIEALRQAAEGVLEDPRFTNAPVSLEELAHLSIEITVVSPLRPAAGPLEFDLLNDGIFLTCGHHAGCFLPQVARETGWTKEQLLDRLCSEKLGVPADTWRDPRAQLQTFSTLIIGPEPFIVSGESIRPGSGI